MPVEKYLTKKVYPGKLQTFAENGAAVLLAAALMVWVGIAVFGFLQDGFQVAHVVMLLIAVPFVLILSRLTDRMRARKHARVIIGALCLSPSGCVVMEELGKKTGVRDVAGTVTKLVAQGLIRDVLIKRDLVCLADRKMPAGRCGACGAPLVTDQDNSVRCPYCGGGAA